MMLRSPGRPPPRLPTAAVVLGGCLLQLHSAAASGANVAHLTRGQIIGVVLGSIGCALLLGLLTCACCCLWHSARRRQTGDLTWEKYPELESVRVSHVALPDASGAGFGDPGAPAAAAVSTAGGLSVSGVDSSRLVLPVAVAAGDDMPPAPSPDSQTQTNKRGSRGGRSTGGGSLVAQLLLQRRTLGGAARHVVGFKEKDKHLEVSKSARVEPSAELEMTIPLEAAATNMGPPLSKSSMLLRWLHGAEDDCDEAVAAQLAAASNTGGAASGAVARSLGAASAHVMNSVSAGGAGVGIFSDRMPLLSLAAQQTGIVWSKMPPSVASSPAVSVTDGSLSRHMLKGTMRRSDAPDGADVAGGGKDGANGLDGDDRYPASLRQLPVDLLSQRRPGVNQRALTGIVFDHVTAVPSSARAGTPHVGANRGVFASSAPAPAPASRAGLPPIPPAHAPALVAASSAAKKAAVVGPTQALVLAALGGDPSDQQQGQEASLPVPWLHQTPPAQLAPLQEEDSCETDVAVTPLRRRPSITQRSAGGHLQPMPVPEFYLPSMGSVPPAMLPLTHLSPVPSLDPPMEVLEEMEFSEQQSLSGVRRFASDAAAVAASLPPDLGATRSGTAGLMIRPWQSSNEIAGGLSDAKQTTGGERPPRCSSASSWGGPPSASPPSPFLPGPPGVGGGGDEDRSLSGEGAGIPPPPPLGGPQHYPTRHQHLPSDVSLVMGMGPAPPAASAAGSESGEALAAGVVGWRRPSHHPQELRPSMSGSSRSPSVVSPSMGLHFPELPDGWRHDRGGGDGSQPPAAASRAAPSAQGQVMTLSKGTAQMQEDPAAASFLAVRESGVDGVGGSGGGGSSSGGGGVAPLPPRSRVGRGPLKDGGGAWARPASPELGGLENS